MRAVIVALLLSAPHIAAAADPPIPVQSPQRPTVVGLPQVPLRMPNGPLHRIPSWLTPEQRAALEVAYADHDRCLRDRAEDVARVEAERQAVQVRGMRAFWEQELAHNPDLRSMAPGGYPQLLRESFEQYRARGGSATRIEDVVIEPTPCPDPLESLPHPPSPITRSVTRPIGR